MAHTYLIDLLMQYRYLVLIPLAAFEGPVISLIVGFLVHGGYFNFWLAYLIMLSGDIGPDSIFYAIGFFGHRTQLAQKYFKNNSFLQNHFPTVEKLWRDHPWKMMFFGKLAYGLGLPLLVSAGMAKMPYKKFISLTIPISTFQYGIIMLIGYHSANLYESTFRYVNYGYLVLLAVAVVFFLLYFVAASRYAKRKIVEMENKELNDHV